MSLRRTPRTVDEIVAWIEERLRRLDADRRVETRGTNDHGLLLGLGDDDHTQYQLRAEKTAASGYPSLDATTKVPTAQLGTGTANSGTFLRGDRTWSATGGFPGAGHTIKEDGTPLTARSGLNFTNGLIATDDAGNDESDVNVDYAGTAEIADIAAAESAGVSNKVPRGDHVHAHPVFASGDLHSEYVRKAVATAKGSIFVATAAGVITELPVGTNGQVLTADSATATGLKYATPASSGHVIQENGTPLAAEPALNFRNGLIATDNAGVSTIVDADYATTAQIADIALVESAGVSNTLPRGDHVHAHPVIASGDLHPEYALDTEVDSLEVALMMSGAG